MSRLLLANLLSGKNKWSIYIYTLIIFIVLIALLPYDALDKDFSSHISFYIEQYNNILIDLLKVIIPIGVLILLIEHDQIYIRALSPTLSRSYIIKYKLLLYTLILTYFFILIIAIYINVLFYTSFYNLFSKSFIVELIFIYLDSLILLLFLLMFIRQKHKVIPIITIIIYILSNFIYEISPIIELFYLIPVHAKNFNSYIYTYLYQCLYIIFLVLINYIYAKIEQY